MRDQNRFTWMVAAIVLLLLAAMWGFTGTPVLAQSTATFTPTATATNTPTATATPLMTQVPLVSNPSGLYYGYGIGNYGAPTPSVAGSAFQSSVGDIDLYSAAGRQTFHVDHATGNVTAYGSIIANTGVNWNCASNTVTGTLTATPVAGATPVGNPLVSLPALTANGNLVAGGYNAGTFTLAVAGMNVSATLVAATTPVAVEWCYIYTK